MKFYVEISVPSADTTYDILLKERIVALDRKACAAIARGLANDIVNNIPQIYSCEITGATYKEGTPDERTHPIGLVKTKE